MRKLEIIFISALIALAFIIRLYKIDRPIGDWHSWRQADTAAVARNFIKEGYTPLVPKFDDMSVSASGLDNPNRYRFVEFPIYNSIVAAVWKFTGVNETAARLTTVTITLLSTLFLYLIVRRFSGRRVAYLAAFFFAFLPYNVFYSSAILPGPLMVLGVLSFYYFFLKYLEKQRLVFLILSIIATNVAILTWPIAIFFLLPPVYLAFSKLGIKALVNPSLWVLAITSLVPFAAWRLWMMRFPEGIPNFWFLVNEGDIRFKGAFFRWLVVERMGKLILTVGGFSLALLGLVRKPGPEKLFYFSYLASVAIYFTVFASGNVRHDYYQIPAVPALAIFMAIGTKTLLDPPKDYFNKVIGSLVAVALIISIFAFSYFEVKGYYWINKPQIITAGKAADRLLPKDATVLAPYNGDAALLYQTNRHGYPITDRPLEKFVEQGTRYLISVDVGDRGIQNLANNCKVIDKTEEYVIVEMTITCVGK